jgi:hypothetical protein
MQCGAYISRFNSSSGSDAVLVKAVLRLTDSLAREAQPIHGGDPEDIHKLLRSAVS